MRRTLENVVKTAKQNSINKLAHFVNELTHESDGLWRLETFCSKNFLFLAKNWDNYTENQFSKKRIRISIALKLSILLMLINFTTCAVFDDNPRVRSFFSNATHLMGNAKYVLVYGLMGSALALLFGLFYNFNELNGNLFVIKFLNDIKHKRNSYKLSRNYSKKFALHISTKYFNNQSSIFLGISIALILIISSIRAYLAENSNYTLLSLIIWSCITMIWSMHTWKLFTGYSTLWYSLLIHIKYKSTNRLNTLFRGKTQNY